MDENTGKKEKQMLRHENRKLAIELQEVQEELARLELNYEKLKTDHLEVLASEEKLKEEISKVSCSPNKNMMFIEAELSANLEAQIQKKDKQIQKGK
jgi:hypothetical protein